MSISYSDADLLVGKTQELILLIKNFFFESICSNLNLEKVVAPLFLEEATGLNDDLNGVENPVVFDTRCGKTCTVVHSLAKWKRWALKNLNKKLHEGIITDMVAIRKDEILSPIHSYLVDQWDWETVIDDEHRNLNFFHSIVKKVYSSIRETEKYLFDTRGYPIVTPESIKFISSQELEDLYCNSTPKQREYLFAKKNGAICITQIGKILKSGVAHDLRAPDYDDWELNGDIILYYKELDIALEVSSMGIRVSEKSLVTQLKTLGQEKRLDFLYHKLITNKKLPYSIGGGIGQSRLIMFLLKKKHIGQVQVSVWDDETMEKCRQEGVELLC